MMKVITHTQRSAHRLNLLPNNYIIQRTIELSVINSIACALNHLDFHIHSPRLELPLSIKSGPVLSVFYFNHVVRVTS